MKEEETHLRSLVWTLREKIVALSEQNETLIKQKTEVAQRLRKMEATNKQQEKELRMFKYLAVSFSFHLVVAILFWVKQRRYSRALAHHIQSLREEEDNDDLTEENVEEVEDD